MIPCQLGCVSSAAAVEQVVSVVSRQEIISSTAIQLVVSKSPIDLICLIISNKPIMSRFAVRLVLKLLCPLKTGSFEAGVFR